ncbi:ABC transporter substrate-binding protein [Cryptosporangium aurantiacum]|uniref:Carbohydrate ABC transporter substrate-binding protein, CUT1 family n=1 Tax=Cryptosporangium aurantiacum TaxID=134849 RepID=A0A1M7R1K2_9ACTN|nr:ABC transporter substrate-binding protein [Cryptosporangium aurantiacum]SHN38595.1 carbohydrate ABC transporter substrate-binding protein, CUT1 family [Cryptosporangium aurantiacum]
MRKRIVAGLVAAVLSAASLAGCGGEDDGSGRPEGEITVLTNRTDIVDTVFQEYKKKFEAKYPDVTVKFEAITDYEGEVRIRMNSPDYGDVLLIPNSVTADQLPSFFEPLGSVDELKDKYRFVAAEQTYQKQVYGIAIVGNAQGFVYNKRIWREAGITDPPKTPAEFLAALRAIKSKTAATPLYTNYKDGWPLTMWESDRGAVSANPDAVNELVEDDTPWAPGREHHIIDSLLYDAVHSRLTEADPTTTNWEASKTDLAAGKIATMRLGSWAISQMQGVAKEPADVGFLPFPTQVDGKFHSVISGDYKNAVNINSKHKAAARAWVTWFADESGYAADQGGIPPRLSDPMPKNLDDFATWGVKYFELNPAPEGKEGLDKRIDAAAEIGLLDQKYRQRLVDAARGAREESKDAIFADLNERWAKARKTTQ